MNLIRSALIGATLAACTLAAHSQDKPAPDSYSGRCKYLNNGQIAFNGRCEITVQAQNGFGDVFEYLVRTPDGSGVVIVMHYVKRRMGVVNDVPAKQIPHLLDRSIELETATGHVIRFDSPPKAQSF